VRAVLEKAAMWHMLFCSLTLATDIVESEDSVESLRRVLGADLAGADFFVKLKRDVVGKDLVGRDLVGFLVADGGDTEVVDCDILDWLCLCLCLCLCVCVCVLCVVSVVCCVLFVWYLLR